MPAVPSSFLGHQGLRVDTAPLYTAGRMYRINGARYTADEAGRLHFAVGLEHRGTTIRISPASP